MKVLKEVTDWDVAYRQPNHTYLLDGDKMIAYKKWHEGNPIFGKSGSKLFSRSRRKFKELPYVASEWGDVKPLANTITVEGSKGNTYDVDLDKESCTCPGYTFRGHCKHIELAKKRVDLQAA